MDYKEEANKKFSKDVYAIETTGVVIEDVGENYARCSLKVNESHMNAQGFVMGGAIFTLADFTFAVAANINKVPTVSLSSTINYINAAKGPVLYAEAKCVKDGRNVCFFEVVVKNSSEKVIATISTNGFRKNN